MPATSRRGARRLTVWWQRGESLRPVVAVTAMVHGDEYEGFAAACRFWHAIARRRLQGSVLLLPVCNPWAAAAATRCTPREIDGRNLARCFPGRASGSPTQQLARRLWNLVEPADVVVDLHSGGAGYDYLPLAGYYREPDRALAACFPLPNLWNTPPNPGVLTYELARRGRRAIGHEYRGEARFDPDGGKQYCEGLLRLLHHLGMTRSQPAGRIPAPRKRYTVTRAQTTNKPGWFFTAVRAGQRIRRGQVLGQWVAEDLREHTIHSRLAGTVIGLRTLPRVEAGMDLVLLGR